MQSEITRLQDQNARLVSLLESERRNSKKARDDLVKKVSTLLVDFSEERDRSLREAVYGVKESNEKAVDELAAKVEEHSGMVDATVNRGSALGESLDEMAVEKEDALVQTFTVSENLVRRRLSGC
jgi:kinesin family protein 11